MEVKYICLELGCSFTRGVIDDQDAMKHWGHKPFLNFSDLKKTVQDETYKKEDQFL